MLRYHLILAIRNLLKNKLNSIINITGLAVGISASLIMFLFAYYEISYNSNFRNAGRIYNVYKERHLPTGIQVTRDTWFPMATALQDKYPEIEEATHLWDEFDWVQAGDEKYKLPVTYAMPNIFKVFSFPLAEGDINGLNDLHGAIISQETALKLFGRKDPLGKTFIIDFQSEYTVKGVLGSIPKNCTYRPEILVSSRSVPWYNEVKDNWGGSWLDTYVLLGKNSDKNSFESHLQGFIAGNLGNEYKEHLKLRLTSLNRLHNETTHANVYAYILFALSIAILLMASINYINLSTARSIERSREIGVQKVLGASRSELIRRYFSESLLVSFLALFIGIIFAEMFLPAFNRMFDTDLNLVLAGKLQTIVLLLLTGLATGLIAGIYPAIIISGFKPVEALTRSLKTKRSGFSLKGSLIVFQFILAILMITGTLIMYRQIDYMKNADLNIDKSNLMVINAGISDFPDAREAAARLETFRDELKNYSGITGVTSSSVALPVKGGAYTFVYPDDRPDDQRLRQRRVIIDDAFFDIYGIKVLDGRNFSKDIASDRDESVIINEAALKDLGWKNIHEGKIRMAGKEWNIIGLVQNYNYRSMESGIEPIIHFYRPSDNAANDYLTIRIAPGKINHVMKYITAKWKEVDPARPLPYNFVDESFNQLYKTQENITAVAWTFTGVAMIISCLGLFALSSLLISYRTKEIGIRKVLGASVSGILVLLSATFTRWIVMAFVIAWPLSRWLMNLWLEHFAYRINTGIWIYLIAGGLMLAAAQSAIIYQCIKAATTNPVESLRYE